jgi:hypothetical protein
VITKWQQPAVVIDGREQVINLPKIDEHGFAEWHQEVSSLAAKGNAIDVPGFGVVDARLNDNEIRLRWNARNNETNEKPGLLRRLFG